MTEAQKHDAFKSEWERANRQLIAHRNSGQTAHVLKERSKSTFRNELFQMLGIYDEFMDYGKEHGYFQKGKELVWEIEQKKKVEPNVLELHNVSLYTKNSDILEIRVGMTFFDYGFHERNITRIVKETEGGETYVKVYATDKIGKEKLSGTWTIAEVHSYESYDSLMRN